MRTQTWRTVRAKVLLAAFVLLNFLPNLLLVWTFPQTATAVRCVLVSGLLFAAVFAALRRRPWCACLLFLPSAMLAPAEAFYIFRYERASDANIVATVLESNLREASEFLAQAAPPLVASMLGAALLCLCTAAALRNDNLAWRHRSAAWILALTLGVPLVSAVLQALPAGTFEQRCARVTAQLHALAGETRDTFPFGLPARFLAYRAEWSQLQAVAQAQAGFRFGAAPAPRDAARHVYVLVIGESSRRDHWSMFGYGRATTPELESIANLVPLGDMLSPWTESRQSVPVIVTRKPDADPLPYFREPSVLRLFAEAGFETNWFSTQTAIGPYDSPISVAAFQAEHGKFLNPVGFERAAVYDDALLAPLRAAIAPERGDQFIVLHMLGSHLLYSMRFPSAFAQFSATPGTDTFAEFTDAYDDSIRYTDHVLAGVIAELQRSGTASALLYLSDHGESLPHNACSVIGHNLPMLSVYPVPAFVWYSDAYAARQPTRSAHCAPTRRAR